MAEKMVVTTAFHGPSASLRPTGVARYFGAVFLLVWLAGWALGETLALGFLVMLIRSVVGSAIGMSWPIPGGDWIAGGAAGFVFLFLLVWLTLWTFGGYAAIRELLRTVAGEDHIAVQPAGVELQRRAGPFRRSRTFERSRIRGVRLRRNNRSLVIDTTSGCEEITQYGTVDERRAVADWLRRQLSLPENNRRIDPVAAPPGWRMTIEGGTTHLTKSDPGAQRIAALILWVITALLGAIWFGSTHATTLGSAVALVLTGLFAWTAAWTTWSRHEWLVQHGRVTASRRFLTWHRERQFKSARLEVTTWTDSDSDDHYALHVLDADGKRKIASEIHDEAEVVDLGEWLAARTGFPLTLPRKLR